MRVLLPLYRSLLLPCGSACRLCHPSRLGGPRASRLFAFRRRIMLAFDLITPQAGAPRRAWRCDALRFNISAHRHAGHFLAEGTRRYVPREARTRDRT